MKVKLCKIADIMTGTTPSMKVDEYYDSNDIPFIKPDSFKSQFQLEASSFISNKAERKARVVYENCILVTCIGIIGKVGITSQKVAFNQQINSLNVKPYYDIEYIAYNLLFNKDRFQRISNSAVVPLINKTQFSNFEILINKDIVIQRKIKNRLNLLSSIINNNKKKLLLLEDIIKSRFVEMFGDIDCNTKNWPIITLEELAELITDGEHSTPKRCDKGIYLLSARNILNHSLKLDDVDYIDEAEYDRISKRVIPKAGDILLSCSGSVGRCCMAPMEIKFQLVRSVALIRFKSEISPIFAEYMITSDWFQRQINSLKTASSQANLFQGRIKKLKGFVPDMNLQYEFIKVVNQINKLKSDVQKSIDETQLLMDSLMQEYFG